MHPFDFRRHISSFKNNPEKGIISKQRSLNKATTTTYTQWIGYTQILPTLYLLGVERLFPINKATSVTKTMIPPVQNNTLM